MDDRALDIAVPFIAGREGFRSAPYLDAGGVPTIAYGFTYLADGKKVTMDMPPMTEAEAMPRFRVMVGQVLASVRAMVHVAISDNAAAALTSFAYNVGTYALRISSIMTLLNEGKTDEAGKRLAAFVYAGGKVCPGLMHRRAAEQALFFRPDDAPAELTADALNQAQLDHMHRVSL